MEFSHFFYSENKDIMDNLEIESQLEDKIYPIFFRLDTKIIKDSIGIKCQLEDRAYS